MIPSTSGPGLLGFIPFILSYQVCVHARWVFESSLESLYEPVCCNHFVIRRIWTPYLPVINGQFHGSMNGGFSRQPCLISGGSSILCWRAVLPSTAMTKSLGFSPPINSWVQHHPAKTLDENTMTAVLVAIANLGPRPPWRYGGKQSSDDVLITGMVYRYPRTPAKQGGARQGRRVWLLQPFGSFLCLHVLLRQWLIHQRLGGLEGLSWSKCLAHVWLLFYGISEDTWSNFSVWFGGLSVLHCHGVSGWRVQRLGAPKV